MVRILLGILLIPIIGWAITLVPMPDSLPSAFTDGLTTMFTWLYGLNEAFPIDTVFILGGTALGIDIGLTITKFVLFLIKEARGR